MWDKYVKVLSLCSLPINKLYLHVYPEYIYNHMNGSQLYEQKYATGRVKTETF